MQQLGILASIVKYLFHHAATQNPGIYCQILISPCSNSESWHLLSNTYFTMWQLRILVSIVKYLFHHVATQNPGHGTKFVTLPSPVLLC